MDACHRAQGQGLGGCSTLHISQPRSSHKVTTNPRPPPQPPGKRHLFTFILCSQCGRPSLPLSPRLLYASLCISLSPGAFLGLKAIGGCGGHPGSNFTLVHLGVLRGTKRVLFAAWTPMAVQLRMVMGERASMEATKAVHLHVGDQEMVRWRSG